MTSWDHQASPHGYPTEQRAVAIFPLSPRPTLLSERGMDAPTTIGNTPRSESGLISWLAFRVIDQARKLRMVL